LKLFKSNKFIDYLKPVAGGICGGISISSYFWIILMPFSLSILWSGSDKHFSNFLWGFSFVLISHYWLLYLHPLTWLGFSWLSSILIANMIWLLCSLLGGAFVILWGLIKNKIIKIEYIFSKKISDVFIRIVLVSLVWSFGELILSKTSFLWIGLGESLIPGDLYLAGLGKWIGSSGVCFLELLFGFWIFFIFERWKRNLNFRLVFFIGIVSIFCLHLIGGYLIQPSLRNSGYPIAIWQTNIPTREKLLLNNQKTTDQILFEQEKALSKNAELLVAPEGTLRSDFVFQKPSKINTLIGGFRTEKNYLRNSLLAFKKGDRSYSHFIDKYRLVLLGERIPKMFEMFFLNLSSLGGIHSGNNERYFEWENTPPLAAVICYEISDGLQIRKAVSNGSKFILSIANLDPYPPKIFNQYLSLIRMRSIENNIDTVFVSNTGPSGLIKSDGRVGEIFESKIEKNEVVYPNLLDKKTFYNDYGIKPLVIVFAFCLIYIFI
tara:strand:+ start:793 stop:2268 length:1476 start_codon:yes stop_codon:yes gene_type:complete